MPGRQARPSGIPLPGSYLCRLMRVEGTLGGAPDRVATIRSPLPDEVQVESLATRVRTLTLKSDTIRVPTIVATWPDHPWFDYCAEFCAEYDQNSFDPDYPTEPLEHFEPLIRSVLAAPKRSIYNY